MISSSSSSSSSSIIIIIIIIIIIVSIVINNMNTSNSLVVLFTILDLFVSSLRRGHANIIGIVPNIMDDPRRESRPYKMLCLCISTLE